MRMTVLASGSKGNATVVASAETRLLIDAGLSCRELLKRMKLANEDPAALDAILITHEHQDHIAGLSVLARRLRIPVYFTEPTHRAWVRMVTPRTTMTYAQWLDHVQAEKELRAAAVSEPATEPGAPFMAASPSWVGSSAATEPGAPFMTASPSWVGSSAATEPGAPHLASEMWESVTTDLQASIDSEEDEPAPPKP